MEHSTTDVCESNDRLLFLKQEQEKYTEGSPRWIDLQTEIDQIVAQNYLEYVNR
jgi:hypothetical protein